jgi:hypothetical protein
MVVGLCPSDPFTENEFVEALAAEKLVDEELLFFLDAEAEQAHQVPVLELCNQDDLILHLGVPLLRDFRQSLHCNFLPIF